MYLKLRSLFLLLILSSQVFAQNHKNTGIVKGNLIKQSSKLPASDIQLTIPKLKLATTTDAEGKFNFSAVPYGSYQLVVTGYNIKNDTSNITVNGGVTDLGQIAVTLNEAGIAPANAEIPTISMEENNTSVEDEGVRSQSVSGLLASGRDPFVNAVSFALGTYHFHPRGYEDNEQEIQVNGIPVNDIETGDVSWNQWGGLNDVFRSRVNTYGLQASEYTLGGLMGSVYFDATAANQRKQTRVSYSLANRNYRNRLMFTQSSGLMKSGWAYSVSVSKRWAKEGYIPGTFYDGYSYYGAVSKVYKKQEFNFTAFGAPTRRGKASPATQETFDLAGSHYYNPAWGYQNGEKRNSRVNDYFQPVFILSHEYKPSEKTRWNTSVAYQFGKNKNSSIDWYQATDPRPDYYQKLPSYYELGNITNAQAAAGLKAQFQSGPEYSQVNWDRLYNSNYLNVQTITNVNGVAGNDVTGKRSLYILSDYVDDVKKWSFNTNLEHTLNQHITLYGGITFIAQNTESYRQAADLLGGDFYLNLNQFTSKGLGLGTYSQNNLDHPNQLIKKGDKYNYDYVSHYTKGLFWAQSTFAYNKFDFFLAGNIGLNSFYREGLFRNGLFPNSSFGNSDKLNFLLYTAKGGVTYKIDGRNYLFVNGQVNTNAPEVDNSFVSINIRNQAIDNPTTEKVQSIEGGYLMKSPRLNARVVGYATATQDGVDRKRYYNSSSAFETFINVIVQNISKQYIGTELALDYKLSSSIGLTAVASIGQAYYTSNPSATVYADNDTATNFGDKHTVYLKNAYLASGPQSAYTLGVNYRSKNYWFANVNFNYLDRSYVELAPDRFTDEVADLIKPGSPLWHQVFDQEKLPSVFTIDLFAGYSYKLSHLSKKLGNSSFLYFSVGINNLLNNTNIKSFGFEQLRYDYTNNNPNFFGNKYMYGYGRNYFVNVSLKF